MTSISRQQIAERWDTLPDSLLDALVSETNSDFLWKTCEDEFIPDEKIRTVAMISSRVLMGFIHPEDVAGELQEAIGIDKKIAYSIGAALGERIFAPLRPEIDKIYVPISKVSSGPQILQEVKPPQPAAKTPMPPMPAPAPKPPAPQIISESFTANPKFGVSPLASNRNMPATPSVPPAPPQPKTNDTGWSTRGPQNPVVTLGAITPAIPSPAAKMPGANATMSSANSPTMPAGGAPKPSAAPGMKSMSEFDRLGIGQKNVGPMPSAPTTPSAPMRPVAPVPNRPTATPAPSPKPPATAAPTPAPVMLHQISASSAQSPEFHVNTGMQNQMSNNNGNAPRPAGPTRPAILEFGNAPVPTPPKPSQSSQSAGYRPPVPSTSPANNGSRQVTEITRPAPIPPAEKVIVKDFLGPEK